MQWHGEEGGEVFGEAESVPYLLLKFYFDSLATDPETLQEQLERAKERIRELETELALLKAQTQNKPRRATKNSKTYKSS